MSNNSSAPPPPSLWHHSTSCFDELAYFRYFYYLCGIIMRYHSTPISMDMIKNTKDNKCWRGRGDVETLVHCWWDVIGCCCYGRQYGTSSEKLKIELPYDPAEEAMATYSSILAWSIPWTEEPGRPQSMGSQRVRHDWSNLALYLLDYWTSINSDSSCCYYCYYHFIMITIYWDYKQI